MASMPKPSTNAARVCRRTQRMRKLDRESGSAMRPLTMLALALSLSGCASDTWSRSDTLWQATATATLLIDGYQTSRIQHTHGKEELGSVRGVCGPLPSNQCTATYFGSIALSHWLIARSLPPGWRRYWQGGMVAIEAPVIYRNEREGIR